MFVSAHINSRYTYILDSTVETHRRSLASIISELKHTRIDLLKMDIEGSEFDVVQVLLELNP
jgi:FkbM family methyltransferase